MKHAKKLLEITISNIWQWFLNAVFYDYFKLGQAPALHLM